jgi:hypothetical protein
MIEIKEREFKSKEEEISWLYPLKYPCLCGGVMFRRAGDNFYKYSYQCNKCKKDVYGAQRSTIDDEYQTVTNGKQTIIVDTQKCTGKRLKNF